MKAEYIDHLGDDIRVVNAARVSFDKESEWVQKIIDPNDYFPLEPGMVCYTTEKVLSEKDVRLLNYLAREGHWTPFSHVMITMRETVPIFVARQRFKHMVGFTYNEVSRRYVDDKVEWYVPDYFRKRADNKKQGSSDEPIHNNDGFIAGYDELMSEIVDYYYNLIEQGIAPEQARMVLPQSMYTSYYVTGSLAAWARAYKQRIDEHAQKEIQDLAHQWGDIISSIPELEHSWKALTA